MSILQRAVSRFELLGLETAFARIDAWTWSAEDGPRMEIRGKGHPFPGKASWKLTKGPCPQGRLWVEPAGPSAEEGIHHQWFLCVETPPGFESQALAWDAALQKALHETAPASFESLEHLVWFLGAVTVMKVAQLPQNLLLAAQSAVPKVLAGWKPLGTVSSSKGHSTLRIEIRRGEFAMVNFDLWSVWAREGALVATALSEEHADKNAYAREARTPLCVMGLEEALDPVRRKFDEQFEAALYDGAQIRGGKFSGQGELLKMKETVSFDQLVFEPKVRENLEREIFSFFGREAQYKAAGLPFKRGVLLEGPPGTGKTSLAKVIAQTFPQTVLWVQGGDIDSPSDLSRVFRLARFGHPSVLFFEDADLYLRSRENAKANDNILAAFIAEMDGLEENEGLLVILTTNRRDDIETAVVNRPGRIDSQIHLGELGRELVLELLRKRLAGWQFEDGWEGEIPALTTLSGASVVELATRTMLLSLKSLGEGTIEKKISREAIRKAFKEQDRAERQMGFRKEHSSP